jgi:hypothetical protein
MNMTATAACAVCASYWPTTTTVRRTENRRIEISAMTLGVRLTQLVASSTLLRVVLAFSCRLTQRAVSVLICFGRARRHTQRPAMPRADAFGRLPL